LGKILTILLEEKDKSPIQNVINRYCKNIGRDGRGFNKNPLDILKENEVFIKKQETAENEYGLIFYNIYSKDCGYEIQQHKKKELDYGIVDWITRTATGRAWNRHFTKYYG